jgi:hypothetical protein
MPAGAWEAGGSEGGGGGGGALSIGGVGAAVCSQEAVPAGGGRQESGASMVQQGRATGGRACRTRPPARPPEPARPACLQTPQARANFWVTYVTKDAPRYWFFDFFNIRI